MYEIAENSVLHTYMYIYDFQLATAILMRVSKWKLFLEENDWNCDIQKGISHNYEWFLTIIYYTNVY